MIKKKGKGKFQKVVSWLHLWPSLVSGIIILFVCLTGTVIVYCDEIMEINAGESLYVIPQKNRITHEEIFKQITALNPNYTISEIVFYKNPKRSLRLRAFDTRANELRMIYMDPYRGTILKEDNTVNFFFITAHLHSELLAGTIGGWIVVIATIIFLIGCVTGLILWWPKKWTKTTKQASFNIKWKAKFKRLNYDLHNVLGFYALPFSIILSITGLILFFHPLMNLTIKLSGGDGVELQKSLPKADDTKKPKDMVYLAYKTLENEYPEKEAVNSWVHNLDEIGAYVFNSGKPGLKSVEGGDLVIYDKYSAKKLQVNPKHLVHEKTENIVWQLHMGQWWGQVGKSITFLTGIIATSLSITGFLIWWGRRKGKQ